MYNHLWWFCIFTIIRNEQFKTPVCVMWMRNKQLFEEILFDNNKHTESSVVAYNARVTYRLLYLAHLKMKYVKNETRKQKSTVLRVLQYILLHRHFNKKKRFAWKISSYAILWVLDKTKHLVYNFGKQVTLFEILNSSNSSIKKSQES